MALDDRVQQRYWNVDQGFRGPDHPVVRTFVDQRIAFLRTILDFSRIENALDVGCGDGLSTTQMDRLCSRIIGTDFSRLMLERHPMRGMRRLVQANAMFLPFPGASFDLVYGWEVLHHMEHPELAVREMARVARRYVLIVEANPLNPGMLAYALWDPTHRWVLRSRQGFLRSLLEGAGLQVLHTSSGGLIFPHKTPRFLLPLLARLPYRIPLVGISNWALGCKPGSRGEEGFTLPSG